MCQHVVGHEAPEWIYRSPKFSLVYPYHICANTLLARPLWTMIPLISAPLTRPSWSVSTVANMASELTFSEGVTTQGTCAFRNKTWEITFTFLVFLVFGIAQNKAYLLMKQNRKSWRPKLEGFNPLQSKLPVRFCEKVGISLWTDKATTKGGTSLGESRGMPFYSIWARIHYIFSIENWNVYGDKTCFIVCFLLRVINFHYLTLHLQKCKVKLPAASLLSDLKWFKGLISYLVFHRSNVSKGMLKAFVRPFPRSSVLHWGIDYLHGSLVAFFQKPHFSLT